MSNKSKAASMRRRIFEVGVVLIVVASVVAVFVLIKQPVASNNDWKNPNAITSTDLIEHPFKYNKKELEFTGEAIGERMVRSAASGGGAWLHLNDDPYMYKSSSASGALAGYNSGMAVWVADATLTDSVKIFGGYKYNGDIVRVKGTFHATCAMHGGDTDIHATELTVVQSGVKNEHPIEIWKAFLAVVLSLIAGTMYLLNRRRIRREIIGFFKKARSDRE